MLRHVDHCGPAPGHVDVELEQVRRLEQVRPKVAVPLRDLERSLVGGFAAPFAISVGRPWSERPGSEFEPSMPG